MQRAYRQSRQGSVKGMHLLVDVPKTPKLGFVSVEGSLIFDQDNAGAFDADYIIAKGGYIEIGTE